ncbi:MAG: hypothetical protein WA738_04540 [Candidatus Angelobacter sp.]
MPIDYMQMLLDLMEERQNWLGKRDEAIREILRLSELIRATMNMVPAEQLARYEPVFERIEQRPAGLSLAIRACFTAGAGLPITHWTGTGAAASVAAKEWFTPVEIRDALKNMGFPFENYKANPLASIHTTLKRMVPSEVEVKALEDGQKVYRLKSAGELAQAFAEARDWLKGNYVLHGMGGSMIGVKRQNKEEPWQQDKKEEDEQQSKGKKRGTSGSA